MKKWAGYLDRLREEADQNPSMSLEQELFEKYPTIPKDLKRHRKGFSAILDHPHCTRNTLKQIIDLSSANEIPYGLARHPKMTGILLDILAKKTTCLSDLEDIVMSPKCPVTLFSYIYDKSGPLAGKEALSSGMGIDWRYSMKKYLASHPKCPKNILREISDHYECEVKALVASNPNTDPDVLTMLSRARSVQVKRGLLSNPKISEDLKRKIKL